MARLGDCSIAARRGRDLHAGPLLSRPDRARCGRRRARLARRPAGVAADPHLRRQRLRVAPLPPPDCARASEHAARAAHGHRRAEGARAVVLQRVDQNGGRVRIGGEEWSARSYMPDQVLEPGTQVEVVEDRGRDRARLRIRELTHGASDHRAGRRRHRARGSCANGAHRPAGPRARRRAARALSPHAQLRASRSSFRSSTASGR